MTSPRSSTILGDGVREPRFLQWERLGWRFVHPRRKAALRQPHMKQCRPRQMVEHRNKPERLSCRLDLSTPTPQDEPGFFRLPAESAEMLCFGLYDLHKRVTD
jgi:hypothetical protein